MGGEGRPKSVEDLFRYICFSGIRGCGNIVWGDLHWTQALSGGRKAEAKRLQRVIGFRLREGRELMELTQPELAKHLGRPQSWVSDVENGRRRVSITELRKYAAALELDFEKLISTEFDADEDVHARGGMIPRPRGNPNWGRE